MPCSFFFCNQKASEARYTRLPCNTTQVTLNNNAGYHIDMFSPVRLQECLCGITDEKENNAQGNKKHDKHTTPRRKLVEHQAQRNYLVKVQTNSRTLSAAVISAWNALVRLLIKMPSAARRCTSFSSSPQWPPRTNATQLAEAIAFVSQDPLLLLLLSLLLWLSWQ